MFNNNLLVWKAQMRRKRNLLNLSSCSVLIRTVSWMNQRIFFILFISVGFPFHENRNNRHSLVLYNWKPRPTFESQTKCSAPNMKQEYVKFIAWIGYDCSYHIFSWIVFIFSFILASPVLYVVDFFPPFLSFSRRLSLVFRILYCECVCG